MSLTAGKPCVDNCHTTLGRVSPLLSRVTRSANREDACSVLLRNLETKAVATVTLVLGRFVNVVALRTIREWHVCIVRIGKAALCLLSLFNIGMATLARCRFDRRSRLLLVALQTVEPCGLVGVSE